MNVDEVIKKYVLEQMGTYRLLSEKIKELLSSILASEGIAPPLLSKIDQTFSLGL